MNKLIRHVVATVLLAPGLGVVHAGDGAVKLTGGQEVPASATDAQGTGSIVMGMDMSVSGSIKTTGVVGTMAHIHLAQLGKNGPVVITLTKSAADKWTVPEGAKLTAEQYAAFKAGNLYVNVHSDAHQGGEIRSQLRP